MKHFKRLLVFLLFIIGMTVIYLSFRIYSASSPQPTFVNEKLAFQNKLVIPPLLHPKVINGEKVFDLDVQAGQTEIFAGKQTSTYGFNGSMLGPTIRVNSGDKVRMNVTNTLTESTTVHWHGMHLPAAMDGGPHQGIQPNQSWQPNWTVTNQASTLWYHPHLMGKTGPQVYRGLAGFLLIDDKNSASLNLPDEYGVDDIPLVVQDRKFDPNGQFVYDHDHSTHMLSEITAGMLGDTILVNGTHAPFAEVPAKLVRLRLLNGSNARRYNFGFSDNRTFVQIATDGGFLPVPVERTSMQLAPGERAEILVDLSNQTQPLTLISYPIEADDNKIRNAVLRTIVGGSDEYQQFNILELRPQAGNFLKKTIPQTLNFIPRFNKTDAVQTRTLKLDTAAINGKKMNTSRVDEIIRAEDIEIWKVRNESPVYHSFHVHGVQFQVLERNRQSPAAHELGWKDTISLNPEEEVLLIMRFPDYADLTLPYMYHCHILEHEDMGMMGQFVVVSKDTKEEDIKIKNDAAENMEEMHMVH